MDHSPSSGTQLFKNLHPHKRKKVFAAAVAEFASKGYTNASMNSVVKAAEISKGSLFQYFRTKRDLFDGVVEMAVGEVKRYLKRVREETHRMTLLESLERLLRAGFAFIDTHPLLARIYFHLLQSGEAPFGAEQTRRIHRLSDEFLSELIREAVARGEVSEELEVEQVAFLVNALMETMLRAYYTEHLAPGLGLHRGESGDLDRWVKSFVDLVARGISTGRPPDQ